MAQGTVTIVQQPAPKAARVGAFLGPVLLVYVQPGLSAYRFLQDAHRHAGDSAEPLSTPHTGRGKPPPAGPVLQAWPDRSCVLGRRRADGTILWHPTPLILPQEAKAVPGLHTPQGTEKRAIALGVDPKGRVLAQEGPAFLIDAWRRSLPEILELWDQTWGEPPAVHHPQRRLHGTFSAAAPFAPIDPEDTRRVHTLLAMALASWSTGEHAVLRWTPGHTTGNGKPIPPMVSGAIHNPHAPLRAWLKSLVHADLWPMVGTKAYMCTGEGHPPVPIEATQATPASAHARLQALAAIHAMLPPGWEHHTPEDTPP